MSELVYELKTQREVSTEAELYSLLEDENLMGIVEDTYPFFTSLLRPYLHGETRLLVVGDVGYPGRRVPAILMGCYLKAARELNVGASLALQQPRLIKQDAGKEVVDALLRLPERSFIVLALSTKLGMLGGERKSFRRFAQNRNHRFLSAPGLAALPTEKFGALMRSLSPDFGRMRERALRLKNILDKAKEVRVRTRQGTNIRISVKGMKACMNVNPMHDNRNGGNLPSGEVYIPPDGKKVDGRIVIDGSVRTIDNTFLLDSGEQLVLEVRDGEVVSIKGAYAHELEKTLEWARQNSKHPWGIRRIAELGIGLNENATICGPTVINEKTLGTAHIAMGSNKWFGGKITAIIHLDHVFRDPEFYVDGEKISY